MSCVHVWSYFGFFLLIICLNTPQIVADDIIKESFYVKPGGSEHDFTKDVFGVTCKFVYVCQGGTHEEWLFEAIEEDKIVTCSVSRESGVSYLFFQQFSLNVSGGKVEQASAMGNSGESLKREEYSVGPNFIKQDDNFASMLTSVTIQVKRIKKGDNKTDL